MPYEQKCGTLFVFAFMLGESVAENEPLAGAVVVFGIATGLIVVRATKFNAMQRAFQNTKSTRSNIIIYEEKDKNGQRNVI